MKPALPDSPAGNGAPPKDTALVDLNDVRWKKLLAFKRDVRTGANVLLRTVSNIRVVLNNHPQWAGRIALNELTRLPELKDPPWGSLAPRTAKRQEKPTPWADEDTNLVRQWLEGEFGAVGFTTRDVDGVVHSLAREKSYHPIRQWLKALQWDGIQRVDGWLTYYFGAADSEYVRLVGRFFLIAAAARVLQPGCKHDHVMVLEGDQGIGKSTAIKALFGAEWFDDSDLPLNRPADAYQHIRGKWCIELAELASLKHADLEKVKRFFSETESRYRPPYGRNEVVEPRTCVFCGSVNPGQDGYLRDPTGARRFWPIKCEGTLRIAELRDEREQLWAEARLLFEAPDSRWHPTPEEQAQYFTAQQEARSESSPWEEPILRWAALPEQAAGFTLSTLLTGAVGVDISNQDKKREMEAARVLQMAGFRRHRERRDGLKLWVWHQYRGGGGDRPKPQGGESAALF